MRVAERRPAIPSPARLGRMAFLAVAAAFFLLPLYVMLVTSVKPMEEIRLGHLFALPARATLEPWAQAWSLACTGLRCEGLHVGFRNSLAIVLPGTALSILLGALNGYALLYWKPRGGNALFLVLLLGAFVPYQAVMFPMVRAAAALGLYGTLPGVVIVHIIFGMPLTTLLFRNHYATLPPGLFMAARVDGGGFWRIFVQVMLPLSGPAIVVAAILQVTNIWNDFILGLVFAGRENLPMTVQLNNILDTTTGERLYNVDMAATLLTSLVPLSLYLLSSRWLMRGLAAGGLEG